MTKNAILFAAVAACLSSGAAMAQSGDYRGDHNQQERSQRQDHQRGDNIRYDQAQRGHDGSSYSRDRYDGHREDRRSDYRDQRNDRGYRGHEGYYDGRGAGPRHDLRRGAYLSNEYRGSRYVVSDWRRHRGLYAPQRGYHWVQAGNDYLLVAMATGLIAQVLLN
jgi:Ni/Co efflux regulator RcnB